MQEPHLLWQHQWVSVSGARTFRPYATASATDHLRSTISGVGSHFSSTPTERTIRGVEDLLHGVGRSPAAACASTLRRPIMNCGFEGDQPRDGTLYGDVQICLGRSNGDFSARQDGHLYK